MSETNKFRALTVPYCQGNGLDIGSGGNPVVPWAIQVDLPPDSYASYNSGNTPEHPVQWKGDCTRLPFHPRVFEFVYSSHLLEDFANWQTIATYWSTFVKPGGHLVILVPDKDLFAEAIRKGQPPNMAHKHEFKPRELSSIFRTPDWLVIHDKQTNLFPGDYNIMFVAKRLR